MFQKTCAFWLNKIMPIVVSVRDSRGKVSCGIGAGVPINSDGWFITAGHVLNEIGSLDKQVSLYHSGQRKRKGRQVTNYSPLFGPTKARLITAHVNLEVDIGAGQLEGFPVPQGYEFPRLRVRDVEQGELLCRLGYPFVDDIKPKWTGRGFEYSNLFPIPMFVNEALVSRFAKLKSGVWIETSSPGLRGQSGGPLTDSESLVCGIQVNTCHYPLGFNDKARNQVFNVGRAVHVQTIRDFLDEHSIAYHKEELA